MITNRRMLFTLLILLVAAGTTGCLAKQTSAVQAADIESVSVECIQACLNLKEVPFAKKEFDDQEAIGLFAKALQEGKRMEGVLDYSAFFLMTIRLKSGESEEYHLNVANTQDPQKAMFLKLPDTEHGYEVAEQTSAKLRDVIYQRNQLHLLSDEQLDELKPTAIRLFSEYLQKKEAESTPAWERIEDYRIHDDVTIFKNDTDTYYIVNYDTLPATDEFVLAGGGEMDPSGWVVNIGKYMDVVEENGQYRLGNVSSGP